MKTKKKSHAASSRFTRGMKVGSKSSKRHHSRRTNKEETVRPMENITGW